MNTQQLSSLRSALFVPLADERFIARAHERGADALLLDLEDSVPPAQKAAARARLPEAARALAEHAAQFVTAEFLQVRHRPAPLCAGQQIHYRD